MKYLLLVSSIFFLGCATPSNEEKVEDCRKTANRDREKCRMIDHYQSFDDKEVY